MPFTLACRICNTLATMCNHAIVAKVLQFLEAMQNGIYVKDSKDRLVSTAATQAGADALCRPACRPTLEALARKTLHAIIAMQRH